MSEPIKQIEELVSIYRNKLLEQTLLMGTIQLTENLTNQQLSELVMSRLLKIVPDINQRWAVSVAEQNECCYLCLIRDDDIDELEAIESQYQY